MIFTVYTKKGEGINEKCLMTSSGDYIGLETGTFYSRKKHYHSLQIKGKIVTVDESNKTGMYHLDGEFDNNEINRFDFKRKYIGCIVTLEKAHFADGLQIYRCVELDEYFSESEVVIIGVG